MWIAGSLSIEPFGPSRWRLRRTRSNQLWMFERAGVRRAGRRTCGDMAIETAREPGASVMAVCVGGDRTSGTDLRRTRSRARRETSGGPMTWLRRVMNDVGEPRLEEELS